MPEGWLDGRLFKRRFKFCSSFGSVWSSWYECAVDCAQVRRSAGGGNGLAVEICEQGAEAVGVGVFDGSEASYGAS